MLLWLFSRCATSSNLMKTADNLKITKRAFTFTMRGSLYHLKKHSSNGKKIYAQIVQFELFWLKFCLVMLFYEALSRGIVAKGYKHDFALRDILCYLFRVSWFLEVAVGNKRVPHLDKFITSSSGEVRNSETLISSKSFLAR